MHSRSRRFENAPPKHERWSFSRFFKLGKRVPPLPVELWIHILSYLFAGDGIHYQNVDYTNFWRYQRRLQVPSSIEEELELLKKDFTTASLVCKTWRLIARTGPQMILRTGDEYLPDDIETLLIGARADLFPFIDQVKMHPKTWGQLTTLVMCYNVNPLLDDDAIDVILANYKLFPTVRCLSLEYPWDFGAFCRHVQGAFPELRSLTVGMGVEPDECNAWMKWQERGKGTVELDKLEMLEVGWGWGDSVVIRCKSLRHCSFHEVSYGPLFVSFLMEYGGGLESLILELQHSDRRGLEPYRDDSFWCYLPNLHTFGINVDVDWWSGFDIPKQDSLRHLYLTLKEVEGKDGHITVRQVQDKIRGMQWLQFIGINEGAFLKQEHANLKRYCKELGIRYSTVPD